MSYNGKKSTAADIAVNAVIIGLAVVIVVLICIYFLKLNGAFEQPEQPIEPHVITEITTTTVTTTEPIITTTPTAVEETIPRITIPLGEYDEEFFGTTFIIGDSLSTGFVNYEFIPAEKIFAQAGITPSSVMTTEIGGKTVYQQAEELSPQYICIMLGTNGISYLEADYMAEKMSLFVDELAAKCPETKIILVSIPPVTEAHEAEKPEKLDKITEYNILIEKLAEEKNLIFVETYSILCDETGYLADEYAETDGLHLKIHAYPVILSRIQEAILNAELIEEAVTETATESGTETETLPAEVTSIPDETYVSDSETTVVPQSDETY